MRSFVVIIFVANCHMAFAQSHQWTWIHGDTVSYSNGIYGVQGVPGALLMPGARMLGSVCTDPSGNAWLFGGYGYDEVSNPYNFGWLNDLWKYDPLTNRWSWMKGSKVSNATAVYGTKGIPNPSNTPGAGQTTITWTDNSGNLWLFGGFNSGGSSNCLWRYDVVTNEWTWDAR